MNKRTKFGLCKNGIVRCYAGVLGDFIDDVNEFIVPILDCNILVEFKPYVITVTPYDNAEIIYGKFRMLNQ